MLTAELLSGKPISVEKSIRYKLEIKNPKNKTVEEAMIQLALPANVSRQQIKNLNVSTRYEQIPHDQWNQSLSLHLPTLAPYESTIIDIRVDLVMEKQPKAEPLPDPEPYLKAEKYLEFNNVQLQQVSASLKANNAMDIAKEIYAWDLENIAISGFLDQERGALFTLEEKKGDCTGHMYLFGALARAKGIPARMMSGFIVESNKLLKAQDYHNWAEIYIDGAWRVVDAMNKNFMGSEDHYVAMKVTVPSKANSFAWSQRLFSAPSGLKVRLL
ncbi:transglutaminase-like domain-containing protein [Thiothrix caldifontis]|nr:transglutaminase domain-containing protein [Thiothrix caldifontis]